MRKQYVSKYIEALQTNPKAISINDDEEIKELDRQLDPEIIVQWRYMSPVHIYGGLCCLWLNAYV